MTENQDPRTDFGDGGVGSTKESFVGTDDGIVSDEQRLPEERPFDGSENSGGNLPTQGMVGEEDRGTEGGTDSRLFDDFRHSGRSGDEASR